MKYVLILNDDKTIVTSFLEEGYYVIGVSDLSNELSNDDYWHIDAKTNAEKGLNKVIDLINDQNVVIEKIINNYSVSFEMDFECLSSELVKCLLSAKYLADNLNVNSIHYTDSFVKEMCDKLYEKM